VLEKLAGAFGVSVGAPFALYRSEPVDAPRHSGPVPIVPLVVPYVTVLHPTVAYCALFLPYSERAHWARAIFLQRADTRDTTSALAAVSYSHSPGVRNSGASVVRRGTR
jgi:hypothetical protein